jgi:hypothetical protein
MPHKDDKGDKKMPKAKEKESFAEDADSRARVKDGVIILDRENPIHRMWMEEDEE